MTSTQLSAGEEREVWHFTISPCAFRAIVSQFLVFINVCGGSKWYSAPTRSHLFAFLREFSALCVVSRGERSSRWNSPPRGHPRPEPQFAESCSPSGPAPIDFAPRSPPLLLSWCASAWQRNQERGAQGGPQGRTHAVRRCTLRACAMSLARTGHSSPSPQHERTPPRAKNVQHSMHAHRSA